METGISKDGRTSFVIVFGGLCVLACNCNPLTWEILVVGKPDKNLVKLRSLGRKIVVPDQPRQKI
jgi:hypothetical protein